MAENFIFAGVHPAIARGGAVVVAGQVKDSVGDVEGQFDRGCAGDFGFWILDFGLPRS